MGSNKNRTYSFEFKLYVVELYLTTEVSYREVALSVGIYDPSTIVKWVNDYRKAGIDALRPKRKGMKHTVSRTKKNNPNKDNQEYLKELEEENLRLRIENAFLKEAEENAFRGRSKNERTGSTHQQSPRTIQIKRPSLIHRNAKSNIYVLAKEI